MHPPAHTNLSIKSRISDACTMPIRDYYRQRQDLLRSSSDWLHTSTDPAAALSKMDSTVGSMRGMVLLEFDQVADHPLVTRGSRPDELPL